MSKVIMDMETGEIIQELSVGDRLISKKLNDSYKGTISKFKEMTLEDVQTFIENGETDFVKSIWHKMKTLGEIDKYGFIKMGGTWFPLEWLELCERSNKYMSKLNEIGLRLNFRNNIKSNIKNKSISNWKQLLDELEIKSPKDRSAFKKFLIKNDVVRLSVVEKNKKMIVNPNWMRKGSFVSDRALGRFKDVTLTKVHPENVILLYMNDLIQEEDLKMVFHKNLPKKEGNIIA